MAANLGVALTSSSHVSIIMRRVCRSTKLVTNLIRYGLSRVFQRLPCPATFSCSCLGRRLVLPVRHLWLWLMLEMSIKLREKVFVRRVCPLRWALLLAFWV